MTDAEKLQLVGPLCDRLVPPNQQDVKTKADRRVGYHQATLAGDELVMSVGRRTGKIQLSRLVLELLKSGQLQRFLKRIKQLENVLAKAHD
jgi:hypothetical protein